MRLQNYQKVIAACKDTTSASGTKRTDMELTSAVSEKRTLQISENSF